MTSLRDTIGLWLCALVLVAGCNADPGGGTNVDSGRTGDSGTGGTDTGVVGDGGTTGDDTGTTGGDSGTTDVDSGTTNSDSGTTDVDSGTVSCAGIECTGFAAVLAAAPRNASSLDNCAIHLHQSDCCGATDALGINHGARTTLCPAEDTCAASYPDPICSDMTITTDTGETTTVMGNVRLRITAAGTCETFVCTSDPCRSAPGISGGCGP